MSDIKIDLNEISQRLNNEVLQIAASDMPQGDKTKAYRRAAQKALNALYLDKKKYGGAKVERRISVNTLSSYLTRLRKALEALDGREHEGVVIRMRHHLLERDAERMKKRYPHHAALFAPYFDPELPLAELRLAKKAGKEQLQGERLLLEKLNKVDWTKGYKSALLLLIKEYPAWRERLEALVDQAGRPERLAAIRAELDEASPAWDDLHKLKIDHEAVISLAMPKQLREEWKEKTDQRMVTKRTATMLVDYPTYMKKLGLLLTQPWATDGKVKAWDPEMTVFALCGATGRRPIEILLLGSLEKVDNERLRFNGSAKKRDGVKELPKVIYSLLPSDLVIEAFNWLRQTDYAKRFALSEGHDMRSQEMVINGIASRPLNELAKRVLAGVSQARRLYDTRAIYARICLERWYQHDPRWERVNEDRFFTEILGHDDPEAQKNYKTIKLAEFDRKGIKIPTLPSRLVAISAFDDQVQGLARGDAAVQLHNWVKEQLQADPGKVINQTVIVREYKAYRPMVQKYLALVGEALMVPKGTSQGLDLSFLDTPVTADEAVFMDAGIADEVAARKEQEADQEELDEPEQDEDEPEQEEAPEPEPELVGLPESSEPELVQGVRRPRVKITGAANGWLVAIRFGELVHEYHSTARTMQEAGLDAWVQWLADWDDVAITVRRVDGWFTLAATLPDGQRLETMGRGKVEQLRRELLACIEESAEQYRAMGNQ